MTDLEALAVLAFAMVGVWGTYRLRRDEGLDLSDEGYLWYGTQRTRAGEVAIRDFRAYEPGRYQWCAALGRIVGTGPIGLRRASHAFFAPVFAVVLLGAAHAGAGVVGVGGLGVALLAWSFKHFKLFDSAACLAGVAAVTALVHEPGTVTLALAVAVALGTAQVSLNHALYLVVATGGATLFALPGSGLSVASVAFALGFGGAIGMAMPAMTAVRRRGYLTAVGERRIRPMVVRGTTNMPKAVPWPWRVDAHPPMTPVHERWAIGVLFVLLPSVPLATLGLAIVAGWGGDGDLAESAVVGASLVALAYTHHAFSRADLSHASPAFQPTIVVLVALTVDSTVGLVVAYGAISVLFAVLVLPHHPAWRHRRTPEATIPMVVGGDRLRQSASSAAVIEATTAALARHGPGATLFAAPILPGLYAAVGVQTVAFDTFCIYPTPVDLDRAMADTVRDVDVAVVDLVELDGRPDLAFSATHPETWRMLTTSFDDGPPLPDTRLFEARPVAPRAPSD